MGTNLSNLSPNPGSRRNRKRIGRGPGSGKGTTAGKGQKGQKCRAGVSFRGFEGGQMPLQRRLPKFGFKNRFRVEFAPVNVGAISEHFSPGEVVDLQGLVEKGMVSRSATLVKVLGEGEITIPVTFRVNAVSETAKRKVEAAGGTLDIVTPPARGPKKPDGK